jgi:hypothetical protein
LKCDRTGRSKTRVSVCIVEKGFNEDLYCERGEMENRIKEQLTLFAGRVSSETMRANQLRVYFAAMAYVLMHGLRRLGLKGTEMARAQATTIRLRLLKIGAQVRVTARKVWLSMASSNPDLAAAVWGGSPEPTVHDRTGRVSPKRGCS